MKLAFSLENKNINYDIEKNTKFKDNNYEFNKDKLKEIPIEKLQTIIDYFNNIDNNNSKLLIDDGLIFYSMIMEEKHNKNIDMLEVFKNIKEIENYCQNIDINNLLYIIELNKMLIKGKLYLSMLGYEVLDKTQKNTSYTYETLDKKIKVLCDIVNEKYKKNTSTIPYINGQYNGLFYSVYDNIQNDVLTCGIDTNTCLKATGAENDFFHYTILSKNGINLKIYDNNNKLIARVSGNRYGNGVYFNQLRIANNVFIDEDVIIKTFEKACEDIINQSNEKEKIEFIIITKSFLTKKINSNIDEETANYIALNCVDIKSKDWQEFITNKNLEESYYGPFINDYGITDLICIKSIIGKITKEKIKLYSAKDLYKRKRNKIKIIKANKKYESEINRTKSIYCYQNNIKYNYQKLDEYSNIIIGDNWYIIYNNEIIDYCCLEDDKYAYIEYTICLAYLKEILQSKILKR